MTPVALNIHYYCGHGNWQPKAFRGCQCS